MNKAVTWFICVTEALASFGGVADAQGFDCGAASSKTEIAICENAELSELDEYMERYYAAAGITLGDGATCLKSDQRDWLSSVRNGCGGDASCLRSAYLERLGVLDALQPGATALTALTLPSVPSLVTALPPEQEVPSADTELALEGVLDQEAADLYNMGIVVRTDDGRAHAIVLDMDRGNGDAHELLEQISLPTKERYLVTGRDGGQGGFSMGDCRFVYRLARTMGEG